MKRRLAIVIALLAVALAAVLAVATSCCNSLAVASPDGSLRLEVLKQQGRIGYRVLRNGRPLLDFSTLGFRLQGAPDLCDGIEIGAVTRSSHDEQWETVWGEQRTIRNHYNEMKVSVCETKTPGRRFDVVFRLFDDGYGFRCEFPEQPEMGQVVIMDELTEFRFADEPGTLSWSIPGNFETYELQYREQPVAEVADANTPFTFRTAAGLYGSVHEAALYDYPEMVLRRDSAGVLKADLAPLPDGVKAYVPATFTTPWRTVQIGRRAVDLINSALILNLNEPSKIADTSWITPQKYVGVWWGMHLGTQVWTMGPRHGATTANALRHIDFAAENNIQGVLFEGWNKGWENWGGNQHFDYVEPYADFDLERIAAYARERGVELWMHAETGGNIPEFERQMEAAMQRYAELGIRTLKTGYAGGFKGGYLHHSQYGVQHYQRVVETAARYGIMLDVHEPIKETGIRRTWPNMMTREGARGMEWNAWSEGNSAEYLCTLPFVRLLSGPMDYTPGIFDIDYSRAKADKGRIEWNGPNGDCCIKTTLARQIANWVIIYSPLQMAADLIENYEGHPAFRFFRDFDADCDWSEALQGEIGDYIVVARRAGERFFLGAGTDGEARTLTQPLGFLQPGVRYTATIYADAADSAANPEAYRIEERTVTADDTLEIVMAARGGQAVTFLPQHE